MNRGGLEGEREPQEDSMLGTEPDNIGLILRTLK